MNGITTDWHTPLFNACVSGSLACVNLLLQHGASPQPKSDLASPIHEAAKRGESRLPGTPTRARRAGRQHTYFREVILKMECWDQHFQHDLAYKCRCLDPTQAAVSQSPWQVTWVGFRNLQVTLTTVYLRIFLWEYWSWAKPCRADCLPALVEYIEEPRSPVKSSCFFPKQIISFCFQALSSIV